MPPFGPISRRELIRVLRKKGFQGPFPAGRHQVMTRGAFNLTIPNPHRSDIDRSLLLRLLKQAGISKKEWEEIE